VVHVKGSVLVLASTVTSFDALEALTTIDGDLRVIANPQLTSMRLPRLTSVGRDVVVEANPVVDAIELDALTRARDVVIADDAKLTGLQLGALADVERDLRAFDLASLESIALPALESVGRTVHIGFVDWLQEDEIGLTPVVDHPNTALRALALPKLAFVGDVLAVEENVALGAVALPALAEVGGHVEIFLNGQLASLDLAGLERVGLMMFIARNEKLALIALPRLVEMTAPVEARDTFTGLVDLAGGQLHISNNFALRSLRLDALERLPTGGLVLMHTDDLVSFEAPKLTELGVLRLEDNLSLGAFSLPRLSRCCTEQNPLPPPLLGSPTAVLVRGNPLLSSLEGLGGLERVDGDLVIQGSNLLTSLAGLDRIAQVTGDVQIDTLGVRSLEGLGALTSVGKTLTLNSLPIVDVDGLRALRSVRSLALDSLTSLRSVCGLASVEALPGSLRLTDNPALESLAGLDQLGQVGVDVTLDGNALLPTCAARGFVDGLSPKPLGETFIRDNKDASDASTCAVVDVDVCG